MFVTDEHTEHYLAIKTGGDSDRGMLTGALGVGGVTVLLMCSILILSGNTDGILTGVILAAALFVIPFLWETRRPLPLPILFNRRTRSLFRSQRQAVPQPTGRYTGAGRRVRYGWSTYRGMRNASLEILVRRTGEPDNALLVSLGLPMGKTLQMQKGFGSGYVPIWTMDPGSMKRPAQRVRRLRQRKCFLLIPTPPGFLPTGGKGLPKKSQRGQELLGMDGCGTLLGTLALLSDELVAGVHIQHRQAAFP